MMVRFTNYTLVIKRENRILVTVRMQEILIMKFSLHFLSMKLVDRWMRMSVHRSYVWTRAQFPGIEINTGIETHTHTQSHAFIIN